MYVTSLVSDLLCLLPAKLHHCWQVCVYIYIYIYIYKENCLLPPKLHQDWCKYTSIGSLRKRLQYSKNQKKEGLEIRLGWKCTLCLHTSVGFLSTVPMQPRSLLSTVVFLGNATTCIAAFASNSCEHKAERLQCFCKCVAQQKFLLVTIKFSN